MAGAPRNFHDLTRAELTALIASWGFSPVHAARLWSCVYHDGTERFADHAGIAGPAARPAGAEFSLARPAVVSELHSTDGFTRKYLLALADGRRIETVLMRFTGRVTACVSSQAGCAMGCGFCATGQMGFARHLTPGEIVAQVLHVRGALGSSGAESVESRWSGLSQDALGALGTTRATSGPAAPERLRNVVLMGMGEPLHNYDAVMKAVDILRDQNGPAIGVRADHAQHGGGDPGHRAPGRRGQPAPPRGQPACRHPGGARRAGSGGGALAPRRADGGLPLLHARSSSAASSSSGPSSPAAMTRRSRPTPSAASCAACRRR